MKADKLNVKVTLLLSFGFFASSIAWSVYNAFVPQILEKKLIGWFASRGIDESGTGFIAIGTLIGLIMTIDNVFGVIFQPLFGKLSDKTRTRFGRRMPYIIIGLPVCVAAFVLVPYMPSLWTLMAALIVFTFVMSAWRTPVVSLMPDLTPGPLRSQANGIVNFMGGLGSLFAFLLGGILFDIWFKKTGNGFPLPFMMSGIMMMLALFVLVFFVREPKHAYEPEAEKQKIKVSLDKGERTSLILILCGIFFWFTGYNAVETFFTLYATNTLGMTPGGASMTLAIFSLSFLGFAVPAGFIGAKMGRRRAILIGLIGLTVLFFPMIFFVNAWMTRACLFIGGFSWAMVNINSLPMVVRLSGEEKIGTYIGYYYFFSFASQIFSPILFGFIHDVISHHKILFLADYKVLFPYSCIAFALAVVFMIFVRHGEDEPEKATASQILDGMGD